MAAPDGTVGRFDCRVDDPGTLGADAVGERLDPAAVVGVDGRDEFRARPVGVAARREREPRERRLAGPTGHLGDVVDDAGC
ncbi:hypothetical protein BRC60_07370 [Halobacteriales archaeon QH_1_68_42]|nr:MAG: hypothetical protein BRC60_07370 [Halobacteriales archaeon QH_1_68_42]